MGPLLLKVDRNPYEWVDKYETTHLNIQYTWPNFERQYQLEDLKRWHNIHLVQTV